MTVVDMREQVESKVHYVYLFVDMKAYRFKIGVSIDPIRRARSLAQSINLSMSVQAGFTCFNAYRIEAMLHKMFREVRIHSKLMGDVNGKTEWFSFEAFPACRNILRDMDAIAPLRRIRPNSKPRKDWVAQCFEHINSFGVALAMRKSGVVLAQAA